MEADASRNQTLGFSWEIRSLIAIINAMTASTVELKPEERKEKTLFQRQLSSPLFSRNLITSLLSLAGQETKLSKDPFRQKMF